MSPSELDLSKVTLLLGSGISQPSGYPLTAEITDTLLSKNWLFDRDQARAPYPLHGVEGNYPLEIKAVWGLLRILRDHVSQHLAMHGKGEANYEDIYFLARQLLDGLKGEYDNPGLLPLIFELRTKVSIMMENLNSSHGLTNPLNEPVELGLGGLLEQGIDFIEECVAGQLAPRKPIKGLEFLNELLATDTKRPLHVVSLTTNKELAYGSGVFLELMFQFHKRLKETDLLIVSGYGFADKGINNRIWSWLDAKTGNRLVVLHEKLDELRRDAKPSFSHNMNRHKGSGRIVLVDKWMCNCSLEDLKREMRFATAESSDN